MAAQGTAVPGTGEQLRSTRAPGPTAVGVRCHATAVAGPRLSPSQSRGVPGPSGSVKKSGGRFRDRRLPAGTPQRARLRAGAARSGRDQGQLAAGGPRTMHRPCRAVGVHQENVIVTRRANAAAARGVGAVSGGGVTRARARWARVGLQRARRGAAGRDRARGQPPGIGAWLVWGGRAGPGAGVHAAAGRARRRPRAPSGAACAG